MGLSDSKYMEKKKRNELMQILILKNYIPNVRRVLTRDYTVAMLRLIDSSNSENFRPLELFHYVTMSSF